MNAQARYGRGFVRLVWLGALAAAVFVLPAHAQDAAAVWQALAQPAFDPGQAAPVENVTLVRDRIHITLASGTIQFSQRVPSPRGGAKGLVFGAAFQGRGRIEVQPPDTMEAQQLRLFTGQTTLVMEFTEAAFVFSDKTYDEIAANVRLGPGGDKRLEELYVNRQKQREDVGTELLPRLFKAILSADGERTALFAADLKTNEKGWIHARFDALNPEEILVGRWADWGAVTLFETWMSFPVGGRSAAEAFRDPLAREDFLARSYHIDANATASAELTATTKVTLEHRVAGERVLVFFLDPNLRVDSVKDANGTSLPFFQPRDPKDRTQSYGDYLAVLLPEPTRAGQAQTLELQYGGKRVIRQVGPGGYFCRSFGWYPTRPNSFAMRSDFEMNFRFPKRFALVATGTKVSETTDGDWNISTWKSEVPLAVAGFAFGEYKIETQKVGNIDVEIYANRQPDDSMRQILELVDPSTPSERERTRHAPVAALGNLTPAAMTKEMATELVRTIQLFQTYFGPYPYSRLAMTNIPYSYGQGWPMLIYLSALSFLDSTQRNELGLQAHVELTDFFRAHESSHQWWGHRVGWKSYRDQWLSEGFAQFSGNLYVQFSRGDKEFLARLRKDKEDLLTHDQKNRMYESIGPIWLGQRLSSVDSRLAYSQIVYKKGGLVLHMLRLMLYDPRSKSPDERFISMMRDFCQTYQNRAASTEDFQAIVEKHMIPTMDLEGDGRMDWFFRQYVYGTGVPQYQMTYQAQDAGGGQWKVTGTVSQSGVPEGWKDALGIYLQQGGKTVRLGSISITEKNTPIEFTLPVKPEKLLLNHFEDTLALIK